MPRSLRAMVAGALTLGALLVAAPAALACSDPYTSRSFAPWGDATQYKPIPGGSFEDSAAWTLTGRAGLVGGGNPRAAAAPSARAISLGSGDTVTSPALCLDPDDLYLRFVARATGAHSHLKASILWTDVNGKPKVTPLDDVDGNAYGDWNLSPALKYKDAQVGAGDAGRMVRVQFTVDSKGATWTLDDVSDGVSEKDACPVTPTAYAFAHWGDDDDYSQVPGGSFDGSLDWNTTGSPGLVADNNPYSVDDSATSAVRLQPGDSITSEMFCIDRYHPHLRFVRRLQQGSARLKLSVMWTDDNGNLVQTPLDNSDAKKTGTTWGVSRVVGFRDALPTTDGARHVQLRFSVDGKSGAWLLDDVFVDPMKRG
jgi:hypothetical protein